MAAIEPGRRAYLDYLARCERAFRPFAPIDLPEFFAGRVEHVRRLETEAAAPGRHIVIYGERGVGKTSLAQLASFFLRRDEDRTHFVRCDKSSTFDSIFVDVLASAGIQVVLNGLESEAESRGQLSVGSLNVGAVRRLRGTYRRLQTGRQITPRLVVEQFAEQDALIIVDEYDRVTDGETHTRMAELIKHLSDAASRTKLVLVGVAESVTQLIGEHASLARSLAQIRLDRMSDEELASIIQKGEEYLPARFAREVSRAIVRLADGFPYFVHLLARHAAHEAGSELLERPVECVVVAERAYASGLAEAINNAEHSLADAYRDAIVTTRRPSEKFQLVLWAMALTDDREVQVQDIARNTTFFTQAEHDAAAFSWTLGQLASEHRGRILTKVREGYYRFTNPLMRPYIRTVMELENILHRGRQWQFPFMA